MKILLVGRFYSEGFAQHIYETLIAMNHLVVKFDPEMKVKLGNSLFRTRVNQVKAKLFELYASSSFYRAEREKKIKKIFESTDIDFTIVCHDFLVPAEVKLICKLSKNAPIALWFPDSISNFHKAMFLDAPYSYLFFKEPFIVPVLKNELNKNTFYLPECCNPVYHKPVELNDYDKKIYGCEITTAGNMHTARATLFRQLTKYDIKIWGNRPPDWLDLTGLESIITNRFVSNIEKSKAFGGAKVVINSLYPTEVFGVNVRLFEVAATAAFQLVSWRPGIKDLYKEGKEIICYRSLKDLQELLDFFLENDDERIEIGQNAYRRTILDHTYSSRLNLMIDTVFNGAEGFALPLI